MRTCRASRSRCMIRTLEAILHGNVPGSKVDQDLGDEERRYLLVALSHVVSAYRSKFQGMFQIISHLSHKPE
jgi:hypothetical protein